MSTTHRFLIVVASTGLALGTASRAHALAQSGTTQANSEPATTYSVSQKTVQLSPITVNGQHLAFPLVLQMIKSGLHRPWSTSRGDRNKLVCRLVDVLGSRVQKKLSCLTNAQHFKLQDAVQLAMINAEAEGGRRNHPILTALQNGQIPVSIAHYVDERHPIPIGTLMPLLKKLPPAGSSYTMRITEHGKPIIDYVIKDGKLTAVHRYIYKKQKKKH